MSKANKYDAHVFAELLLEVIGKLDDKNNFESELKRECIIYFKKLTKTDIPETA